MTFTAAAMGFNFAMFLCGQRPLAYVNLVCGVGSGVLMLVCAYVYRRVVYDSLWQYEALAKL
jgi:hypothetical protein